MSKETLCFHTVTTTTFTHEWDPPHQLTPTLLRLLLPRFHFPSQFYPMTNEDDFTDPGTDSEGDYKEDDLGLTSDDVRQQAE